jgi:hypothetical protein
MLWRIRVGSSLFSEARGLSQAFEIVEPKPPGRQEEDVIGEEGKKGQTMAELQNDHPKSRELVRLTKERAKEKGLPFRDALVEIGRENGDLVTMARMEVLNLNKAWKRIGGYDVLDITDPNTVRLDYIVAKLARERAAEKGIGFSQALSEVSRENPALIARYRAQVLGID